MSLRTGHTIWFAYAAGIVAIAVLVPVPVPVSVPCLHACVCMYRITHWKKWSSHFVRHSWEREKTSTENFSHEFHWRWFPNRVWEIFSFPLYFVTLIRSLWTYKKPTWMPKLCDQFDRLSKNGFAIPWIHSQPWVYNTDFSRYQMRERTKSNGDGRARKR